VNPKQLWKLWRIYKGMDMEKIKTTLGSRKFLASVVGAIIASAGPQLGLGHEQVQWIVTLITGYIVGQGIADHGAASKAPKP
jgi:hypothetical protein